MEQKHPETTGPDGRNYGNEESLADYVKRMETEENLRKLAQKLESDLKNPAESDSSAPDLSFEKFNEKRKLRGQ